MRGILFDHIAIALPRMADAPAVLVGVLGGEPLRGARAGVFRWGIWRFAGGGCLEIVEPLGPGGFLHRFLAERGPGVHHVTFRVPSLAEACGRAEARGYRIVGHDGSDPEWQTAFLHPKQALGIVVQLAQSSGQTLPPWTPPPGPPDPPPPVTIVGLRMRARSRARASTQWQEILQAEESDGPDGALIYRWPGSPMRLVVEIDPAGEEGPLAIEFASARAVALPEGPHPVLRAVFARVSRRAGAGAPRGARPPRLPTP